MIEHPPQTRLSQQSFEMTKTAFGAVSLPKSNISFIGHCRRCLIYERSRTFICEDSKGHLIGACFHEITDGKLMRCKFGQYLTIIKQSTEIWPIGDIVRGEVIESKTVRPKNKRPWVDHYFNIFQMNVLTKSGQMYTKLSKYDKKKKCYIPYINFETRE